jgi:hypothetical protein
MDRSPSPHTLGGGYLTVPIAPSDITPGVGMIADPEYHPRPQPAARRCGGPRTAIVTDPDRPAGGSSRDDSPDNLIYPKNRSRLKKEARGLTPTRRSS